LERLWRCFFGGDNGIHSSVFGKPGIAKEGALERNLVAAIGRRSIIIEKA
jgi:hypothetical protein